MFQCKDILSLVSMTQAELLAGFGGLDKNIRWSYKAENLNFEKWVKGEELLIVSSPVTQRKNFDLYMIIKKAIELRMSSAILMMGKNYVEEVDENVLELAERNNFPLFSVPWDTPLLDFFEELGHAISYLDDRKDIQDNLLAEIIFGGNINIPNIQHKCNQMGYEINVLEQIFVMHIDDIPSDEVRSYAGMLNELFKQEKHTAIVSCYGDRIIGFMKDTSQNKELIISIFNKFSNYLNDIYPGLKFSLNIGEKCSRLDNLKKNFDTTSRINGILKQIGKTNQVVFQDQMGIYQLLMSYKDVEPMKMFVQDVLGNLIQYDKDNNTQLLKTMWTYYNCNCNLQKTADELFAHKNTIKYRLQRVKEISGRDFNNSLSSLEIYDALIMYYYLNCIV